MAETNKDALGAVDAFETWKQIVRGKSKLNKSLATTFR
jgi:hypothetical protein